MSLDNGAMSSPPDAANGAAAAAAAAAACAAGNQNGGGNVVSSNVVGNQNGSGSPGGKASCAPAPPVEIKLFVGRVPTTMDESMLQPVFEEFGEVRETVVIRDKATGKHKSSAFVKMASICQADAAVRALNNLRSLDSSMGNMQVKYATGEVEKLNLSVSAGEPGVDQAKLFVGSLPRTVSEDQIRNLFTQYGQVDEIYIMKEPSGQGKGCAFVKFAYKEQAIHAIKCVDGKTTLEGCSRPVEARFAESRQQRQQQQMAQQQNEYRGGMGGPSGPSHWSGHMGGNPSAGGGGMAAVPPPNTAPRKMGPWSEYFAQDGRPYYHNEIHNTTQWERPNEFDNFMPMTMGGGMTGRGNAGMGMQGGSDMSGAVATSNDVQGPPGSNIFIFHVPQPWTKNDLIQAFSSYGTILSARVAMEKSGRNKGYGFVSFDNAESANAAVQNMNGFLAMGKRLKVTIKKGEENGLMVSGVGGGMGGGGMGGGGMGGGGNGGVGANMMGMQHQSQQAQHMGALGGTNAMQGGDGSVAGSLSGGGGGGMGCISGMQTIQQHQQQNLQQQQQHWSAAAAMGMTTSVVPSSFSGTAASTAAAAPRFAPY